MIDVDALRENFDREGYIHFDLSRQFPQLREMAHNLCAIDESLWSNIIKNRLSQADYYPENCNAASLAHEIALEDYAASLFTFSFRRMPDNPRSEQSALFLALKKFFTSDVVSDFLNDATGRMPVRASQFYLNRFDKGHFLNTHCDPGQSFGVTVNFSENWDPNHGGLTTVLSDDRHSVRECLVPSYCRALIFDTSKRLIPHFVSMVTATPRTARIAAVVRYDE